MKNQIGIDVQYAIDHKDVVNLIETGLDGIRYWGGLVDVEGSLDDRKAHAKDLNGIVFSDTGALIIKDFEGNNRKYRLDLLTITRGFLVMAKKEPAAFADFLTDNEDMNTGDAFIQCALFGKVKYS